MSRLAVVVLGLLAATLVAALPATKVVNPMQVIRRGPPPPPKQFGPARAHTTQYFTQRLDHFDAFNNATWQQRYFISTNAYTPGAPVFLYLAGEWEADPGEVEFTFVGQLANNFNGFTIDLEHRYYGQSRPTPDTSSANLKYLSVDQALEDAATFALSLKESLGLNGPWIVVGGSYSANMAAWARGRYPHIFYGAYASSAPILAQLDFPEYMEVVNEALVATDPACPAVIQASTDELDALIEAGDSATITQLFNLFYPIDLANQDDVMNLRATISYLFAGEVQYARGGNLVTLCQTIVAGQSTPLQTVAQYWNDYFGGAQLDITAKAMFDYYRDDIQYSGDVTRQWVYQTATEFGYYQSLSSPNQPFGQNVPLSFSILFNLEVYGPEFTQEVSQSGVDRSNLEYGGLNPEITRVIYTHGSLDPWHALGRETDLNPDSPVIMIDGHSHCRDLGSSRLDDEPVLLNARQRVIDIIATWLV
ncbi:putative serine protease K12H4.7 [Neocloeon triangulifer]|uniref:putative serine protease K12H4.7 n=1 Tax=Neocloeon triangulifer TaxID=2078957 RepID=UPI00286F4456|nr:putative serine protease K12H4.7 [Neocloeon triangulifer]